MEKIELYRFDEIARLLKTYRQLAIACTHKTVVELFANFFGSAIANSVAPSQIVFVVRTDEEQRRWVDFFEALLETTGKSERAVIGVNRTVQWGHDRFVNQSANQIQRMKAIHHLCENISSILVCSVGGLLQKTLPFSRYREQVLILETGLEIEPDRLEELLIDFCYRQVATVTAPGEFSWRGGIIDFFPPQESYPLRIEFFGEQIETIRRFHTDSQRSVEGVSSAKVTPMFEVKLNRDSHSQEHQLLYNALLDSGADGVSREGISQSFARERNFDELPMFVPALRPEEALLFDYFDPDCLFVFPYSISEIEGVAEDELAELESQRRYDRKKMFPAMDVSDHLVGVADLLERLRGRKTICFTNTFEPETGQSVKIKVNNPDWLSRILLESKDNPFQGWIKIFRKVTELGGQVQVVAHQKDQLTRLEALLEANEVSVMRDYEWLSSVWRADFSDQALKSGLGELTGYTWFESIQLLVVAETELFGISRRVRRAKTRKLVDFLSSFNDVKPGDLVVHRDHGVARYDGMRSIELHGIVQDFLILNFYGSDKIYLPVDRLGLLERYTSSSGTAHLDRLGTTHWSSKKSKVKKAIADLTEMLLKQEAIKKLSKGPSLSSIDDIYFQVESDFPFDETEDQLNAMHDVASDLESGRVMDRLICGDVGFGKTEVALRCATRIVLSGFQVIVLVPTTILCYQHYQTFHARLSKYGISVGQINRFGSAAKNRDNIEKLNQGSLDVLIGTHKALSSKVKPKNLGLIIVDEEQKFGVVHKEKIRALQGSAHVLTLSATPIPRTLHMAMVGLRSVSIIATPPTNRLAVKTYVAEDNADIVKEAIEREVRRGGQVFYVHNRVSDIEELARKIKDLLPEVSVCVGHGQMSESQLERTVLDFVSGKYQVLVCTVIIESGIDMPNVNTLIVDKADRFGLTQLYQLRGRVGRSYQQAYAYFLTPAQARLSEDAQKRLEVLEMYQDLGSGFQVASQDLEMRGAGDLLGAEQSGHVESVGFDLYSRLLDEEVKRQRGEQVDEDFDVEIKLPISARIPDDYIADDRSRLKTYKDLFQACSREELEAFFLGVRDRYGSPPVEVDLLFLVAKLKLTLKKLGATGVSLANESMVEVRLGKKSLPKRTLEVIKANPLEYHYTEGRGIFLDMGFNRADHDGQRELMGNLQSLMEKLSPEVK